MNASSREERKLQEIVMQSTSLIASVLGWILVAGAAQASGTRIITQPGGPVFADIQSAVNASHAGDVIFVGSGTYAGFTIDGKGVWVVAPPNAFVHIAGQVVVQNIAPGEDVLLSGLDSMDSRFSLLDCAGDVRLQGCQFISQTGAPIVDFPCFEAPPVTPPANLIQSCERVSLFQCNLAGADGISCTTNICRGGEGQAALSIVTSDVALYACNLSGGDGGNTINCAQVARGGNACTVRGALFASGSTFQGGKGGNGGNQSTHAGPGGDGVFVETSSIARFVACTTTGGAGGMNLCFPSTLCPGPKGADIDGRATQLAYARAECSAASVHSNDAPFAVSVNGAAQAEVAVPFALAPAHHYSAAAESVRLLPFPGWVASPPWTLSAGGHADFAFDVAYPTTGVVQRAYAQCFFRNTSETTWHFGNPLGIVCIDASAGPDCDGNGVCDFVDVYANPSSDANSNLVPDSCPGG